MRKSLTFTVLVLLAATGSANAGLFDWGARAGFSSGPDQLVFGAHGNVANPFPGWVLQTVGEFGTGDDLTTIAFSGDVLYGFSELATENWSFAAGGGLGFIYWDADRGGSESEIGLNIVGAITRNLITGNELTLELRIGIDELPDFKITAGFNFF